MKFVNIVMVLLASTAIRLAERTIINRLKSFNKIIIKTFYLLLLILISSGQLYSQTYGRNGMVVSSSNIASETGISILKKGGNAIDAAIATAFALAVTHPAAGNIGGGGFMVFMNSNGWTTSIDFREKAPLGATAEMFLDSTGQLINDSNHFSAKAVGVPGTVAGLFLAHSKYGKLPWHDVVQPAIDLASKGFEMNWSLYFDAKKYEAKSDEFPFLNSFFRNDDGRIPEPGKIWKQPELANTLSIIRDKGHDGFYKGEVAKEIADFMKKNHGLITMKDLAEYEAIERKPLEGTYKEYKIYTMPPPGSGGVALLEMMNIMEMADFKKLEFNSAEYVHFLAESMRRAFADRARYLGDPDFNPEMPVEKLISKDYARKLFNSIDMQKASVSDPSGFSFISEGDNTTHFSVIDTEGNAVSLTYTLEYSYGSGLIAEKLGFIFNNEMGDFNPVPGITTNSGQIGTKPNLIEPGKRMLSSMTPTIVAKNGKPYLIIGSPGGRTIINTVFQTILCVVEYNMNVKRAIEAMKIHHQWLPDQITYEENLLSPDTRKALEKMGHKLTGTSNLGSLMGIMYDFRNDVYVGAFDSSAGEGGAAGY